MLKIGIITFHKAHNYGAFLQCYALQSYLQQLGADVSVVDYDNPDLWDSYRIFPKKQFMAIFEKPSKILSRAYKYFNRALLIWRRHSKFVKSQKTLLNLQPIESIAKDGYDVIFIGSDQVWNLELTHGFDSYYWGTFDKPAKTKVATYAASLRSIWPDAVLPDVFQRLEKLSAVSTREKYVADFLNDSKLKQRVVVVPDPVFLMTPTQWADFASEKIINEKYLFFYEVIHLDHIYNIARNLAKQRGLKFVYMHGGMVSPNSRPCLNASPADFISLIKNAELIVTSSFHAMVFSILFQKDFYAVDMQFRPDYRLISTLEFLGLEKHYITSIDQCVVLPRYDIFAKQEELVSRANQYLTNVLNS